MNRLPIRVRLTAAFALAMVVVLAGAAAFVYVQLRIDLDDAIDADLQARIAAGPSRAAGDPDEQVTQLLRGDGKLVEQTGVARGPVLAASEARQIAADTTPIERHVDGYDANLRLAVQVVTNAGGGEIFIVGLSLEDRDEALSSLITSFAVGGGVAVVLASILGYLLAASALRPVENMRRRAAGISLERGVEELPLPAANDEIRRLGETLNEMLERLRRSFERERQFVGDASHELRTPIAVIKAELEASLRSGDLGPNARESLVAAIEECDHLAQLAEDLLGIARSADGKLPLRVETVDVKALLEGVRDRFTDRAAAHNRTIDVSTPEELRIQADPTHLRRALSNLVDNALRYGDGDVVLSAQHAGHGTALAVTDDGDGFSPAFAAHAFERFSRGDQARTRGGTGLGLAIVSAIAEAHGGSVEIVPASGATVRLHLP